MATFLHYYLDLIAKNASPQPKNLPTLDNLKQDYLAYLLEATNQDIEEVARILNIPRRNLERKLVRFPASPA